jgi:hypothetical protein
VAKTKIGGLAVLLLASGCNLKFQTTGSLGGNATSSEGRSGATAGDNESGGGTAAAPTLDEETWAAGSVAAKLGGEAVASGSAKDALKVEFKAKAGWCYSVVMSPTGGKPELGRFAWTLPKKGTHLQRYSQLDPITEGVCVTEDTSLRGEMSVTFVGSAPQLRYAVVGWSKAAFPAHQLHKQFLYLPDPCDTVAWRNIWIDPVPGTLLYYGDNPILVETTNQGSVVARDLHAGTSGIMAKKLANKPAGDLKIPEGATSLPECHCVKGLMANYEAETTIAGNAKERAKTSAERQEHDRVLRKIEAERDGRIKKECREDRAALQKEWKAALDTIVDTLSRSPTPPGVSRLDVMKR